MTSATNPNGIVEEDEPADAADKEFMDVDPDTGRLIMSWSNFTPAAPGGVEIRTAFSDNAKTAAVRRPGRQARSSRRRPPTARHRFRASPRAATTRTWRGVASRSPGTFFGFGNTVALRALAQQRRDLAGADRDQPSSSPWTRCWATIA